MISAYERVIYDDGVWGWFDRGYLWVKCKSQNLRLLWEFDPREKRTTYTWAGVVGVQSVKRFVVGAQHEDIAEAIIERVEEIMDSPDDQKYIETLCYPNGISVSLAQQMIMSQIAKDKEMSRMRL